ncbi:MAG: hypothetical protein MI741_19560 [Rhodospirillales bacterium]|nr:hypothetical protein [Rhodospirillales bacterium]
MLRMGTVMLGLLAAGLIGACAAPKAWDKPETSTAERRADLAQCRKRAGIDVESRYGGAYGEGGGGVGASFQATMRQHDAVRHGDRLIEECMRAKGYARTR